MLSQLVTDWLQQIFIITAQRERANKNWPFIIIEKDKEVGQKKKDMNFTLQLLWSQQVKNSPDSTPI